jgi:hypothetical protein
LGKVRQNYENFIHLTGLITAKSYFDVLGLEGWGRQIYLRLDDLRPTIEL